VFAGDALIKMTKVSKFRKQWGALAGLGVLSISSIVIIFFGAFISAIELLDNQWIGFVVAVFGIIYFYFLLSRIEVKYRQLTTPW
jgi:hypothetical protein